MGKEKFQGVGMVDILTNRARGFIYKIQPARAVSSKAALCQINTARSHLESQLRPTAAEDHECHCQQLCALSDAFTYLRYFHISASLL